MAMLLVSLISVTTILWAAVFSFHLVRHWDVASGHTTQINLEKKTYLISTALVLVLVIEALSLVLYTENAERMSTMFVGAMCALGTLNVNTYGYPALLMKILVFFGAAVWIIINHADNNGRDYPFTHYKYLYLIGFTPVFLIAAALQLLYFLGLNANVITSCCSSTFTPTSSGVEADLAGTNPVVALVLLFGGYASVVGLATFAVKSRCGAITYSVASAAFFCIGITAVIAVIAPYIYEQINHHCPFCILKPEYGYIGYWLYLPVFAGTAAAIGIGALSVRPQPESLNGFLSVYLHKLKLFSIGCYTLFTAVCLYAIFHSNLILLG